jgi:hypothetical protein
VKIFRGKLSEMIIVATTSTITTITTNALLVGCLVAVALVEAHPLVKPCGSYHANPTQYAPGSKSQSPLVWSDWNFIATTDTHGWEAGHGLDNDGQYSADWAGTVTIYGEYVLNIRY